MDAMKFNSLLDRFDLALAEMQRAVTAMREMCPKSASDLPDEEYVTWRKDEIRRQKGDKK